MAKQMDDSRYFSDQKKPSAMMNETGGRSNFNSGTKGTLSATNYGGQFSK